MQWRQSKSHGFILSLRALTLVWPMRAAATPRCPAAAFRRYVLAACIMFLSVPSSRAAFVAVPQQLISDPSVLRLARADALRIQYSAIAYNSSVADLPAFRLSLDARFTSLTPQQFDALFAVYSFGSSKSRVIYNSSATYHFSDFLPPLLQAVNTLHFHTQYGNYSLPDVLTGQESAALCQRTQLSINCWGFAYDVLLSSQTHKPMFTLSVAHSQVAWSVLTSPFFSAPLQSSNSTPDFFTNATARYTGLIPGDYFLIFHDRCEPSPPLPLPLPSPQTLIFNSCSPSAARLAFSSTTSPFTSTTTCFSSAPALATMCPSASQTGPLYRLCGRAACFITPCGAAQPAAFSSSCFPIRATPSACTTT
jgi:hypothetical protein